MVRKDAIKIFLYFVIGIELISIVGFSVLWFLPNYDVGLFKGNSMFPAINNEDLIVTRKFRGEEIKSGMVVGYSLLTNNDKDLIFHRVIEVDKKSSTFIGKGDNNKEPDPWNIDISSGIKRIYYFKIPYLGYIISFANRLVSF